ncbi:MAG: YARHG domain-containing protein [Mucilaginibacter sp.]
MKAKPVLIIFGALVLITVAFLFVRSRNVARPQKNEVYQFLILFNAKLQAGNKDSLLNCFEVTQKSAVLNRLISVLSNKTGFKGTGSPLFNLVLDVDHADIKILNGELAEASVPVKFTSDSVAAKLTVLKLKVHKVSAGIYKIVQVDAKKMMADYIAYNNLVKSKSLTDKDIYSPITLAAFETAKQLQTKYDSVVWFAHVDQKTFYYVVKGKWLQDQDVFRHTDSTSVEPYKMGLVGPDLKEIIPVEYDLIHNISGTFPGLVEVEKGYKRGFFDLQGKIVLPVSYDQIFPLDNDENLAVLRNGDDYFYLKKDMSVSDKAYIKVGEFFPKLRKMADKFNLFDNAQAIITEYNSRLEHGAVYVAPSYLADMGIINKEEDFKNPLRKVDYESVSADYNVDLTGNINDKSNWLQASFYSVRDYFLGGREEFYDRKNIVIVDKKRNRIFGRGFDTDYSPGGDGSLQGACNINDIRQVNDSLFEVKTGAALYADLYDSTRAVTGGPYYHYLAVKNNKLLELPNNRTFGFTKYMKMDDSFLNGCYVIESGPFDGSERQKTTIDHLTPEILRYMKNEIYADYAYKFKDKRWQSVFGDMPSYYNRQAGGPKEPNVSVDDSLTAIDKYNINWIVQKLKGAPSTTLAAK